MVSQYLMQFLQVSEYMVRRYSGVLIGISVKISRIDRFSSSVICGQITEGTYLSIMYLLIGNRLKIFYWNNFRYLPIDKWFIDWFSPKLFGDKYFFIAGRVKPDGPKCHLAIVDRHRIGNRRDYDKI